MSSAATVTIPVTCPRSAKTACVGAVSLRAKNGTRTVRLGGGEFYTEPGERDPVLIGLTKNGRSFFKTRRTARATLFLSARDEDGSRAKFSRAVTIQNPRAVKPKPR